MQYLYASGEAHVFMDNGTYEQIELGEKQIERELKFLKRKHGSSNHDLPRRSTWC